MMGFTILESLFAFSATIAAGRVIAQLSVLAAQALGLSSLEPATVMSAYSTPDSSSALPATTLAWNVQQPRVTAQAARRRES